MAAPADSGPVIVVTGGNRGIGFEICRQLAGRGARVVLTARKPAAGAAAVKKLAAENLAAEFQPLDVTDGKSIAALRDFLQDTLRPARCADQQCRHHRQRRSARR